MQQQRMKDLFTSNLKSSVIPLGTRYRPSWQAKITLGVHMRNDRAEALIRAENRQMERDPDRLCTPYKQIRRPSKYGLNINKDNECNGVHHARDRPFLPDNTYPKNWDEN
jgi:hypothetical protein